MRSNIGFEMVVVLVTLLHVWLVSVTASSLGNNYDGEHLRRNLLANGLGKTPPMGYVTKFLLLIRIL